MRELTRARETAMNDLRAKRQQISAFDEGGHLRRDCQNRDDARIYGVFP
jgi:hypothetical protein